MRRIYLIAGLCLSAPPSFAQSALPLSPPSANGSRQDAPTPTHDLGRTGSTPAIRPSDPDPAMSIVPPQSGITPVIPPPGAAGGNPAVVPK
jgi:hypothetical protein